jgi:hypothetical protein
MQRIINGNRFVFSRFPGIFSCWILVLLLASNGFGQRFRVDNTISLEGNGTPEVKSTTIFHDGKVYDFIEENGEITVFNPTEGFFLLLDPSRRLQTKIATEEVRSMTRQLQTVLQKHPDPFVQFLSRPIFEEAFDQQTGWMTFDSSWISYHMETRYIEDRQIAERYQQFAKWYCLLNIRLDPRATSLFARLAVNQTLEAHRRFPQKVYVRIRPQGEKLLGKSITMSSEHHLVQRLLEADEKRIQQTERFLEIFREVPFNEYQKTFQQAE